jgi:hypothetical protein
VLKIIKCMRVCRVGAMSEESLVELVGCWKVTIETKAHSSLVSGLIHAVGACRSGSESFMISQAIAS